MSTSSKHEQMVQKLVQLRKELEELGYVTSYFFRAPGAAKDPVAYLLVGETSEDVEAARADRSPFL